MNGRRLPALPPRRFTRAEAAALVDALGPADLYRLARRLRGVEQAARRGQLAPGSNRRRPTDAGTYPKGTNTP